MITQNNRVVGLAILCGLMPAGAALGDVIPLEVGHSTEIIGTVRSYDVPGGDGFRRDAAYTEMGVWDHSDSDSVSYWDIDVGTSILYHGDVSPTHLDISTTATSHVSGTYATVPSPTGESEAWSRTHYRFQITEPMYISIEVDGVYPAWDMWGSGTVVWLASATGDILLNEIRGNRWSSDSISFGQMLPAGEYTFSSSTVSFLVGIDFEPTNSTAEITSNIRMSLIPSPASAALLGLAGIVGPPRRRR